MEIEKKYLTPKIPFDLSIFQKKELSQCYISTDPVIRLRKSDNSYILTVKGKGTCSREEFELEINEKQYEKLLLKAETRNVEKTRYFIPLEDGHTAEVDIYHNYLDGLITTEVEFISEYDMNNFTSPEWFGKDVSSEQCYKNTYLALYGIPDK